MPVSSSSEEEETNTDEENYSSDEEGEEENNSSSRGSETGSENNSSYYDSEGSEEEYTSEEEAKEKKLKIDKETGKIVSSEVEQEEEKPSRKTSSGAVTNETTTQTDDRLFFPPLSEALRQSSDPERKRDFIEQAKKILQAPDNLLFPTFTPTPPSFNYGANPYQNYSPYYHPPPPVNNLNPYFLNQNQSQNTLLIDNKSNLINNSQRYTFEPNFNPSQVQEQYYGRIDRILLDLGYCSRVGLKRFLRENEIAIKKVTNKKHPIIEKLNPNNKKFLRQLVSPQQLLINGNEVPKFESLMIAIDKPAGWMTHGLGTFYNFEHMMRYHQKGKKGNYQLPSQMTSENGNEGFEIIDGEEEEYVEYEEGEEEIEEYENEMEDESEIPTVTYSIFDILPKEYPFRRPMLHSILPLPDDISGLTILTQSYNTVKSFNSVRAPSKRVYRIQTRDRFTGLEEEALLHLRSGIKKSVKKVINAPEFIVVDEKQNIAEITLYDYRPDNISQMLTSIRHEPLDIRRIGLGGLSLDDFPELKQPEVDPDSGRIILSDKYKYWIDLNEKQSTKLLSSKKEVVERIKIEDEENKKKRREKIDAFIKSTGVTRKDFESVGDKEMSEADTLEIEQTLTRMAVTGESANEALKAPISFDDEDNSMAELFAKPNKQTKLRLQGKLEDIEAEELTPEEIAEIETWDENETDLTAIPPNSAKITRDNSNIGRKHNNNNSNFNRTTTGVMNRTLKKFKKQQKKSSKK
ncbi:hypothetical protein ABK040_016822 [Willaertia magna]